MPLALLVVVGAADRLHALLSPAPDVGHWDSAEGLAEYTRAYDAVMSGLPAPTRRLDVPTTYGTVRVLEWRADVPDARPVVLLPGRSSGAPMWGENLPDWIGTRTIYALDPIGDAGMSAQSTPLESFDDQAEWIAQTIDGLDAGRAVRDRALAEIGGTTVEEVRRRDPMTEMIDAASRHYSAALPLPHTLTDDEVVDWPRATHSLPMQYRAELGPALSGFRARHDGN